MEELHPVLMINHGFLVNQEIVEREMEFRFCNKLRHSFVIQIMNF